MKDSGSNSQNLKFSKSKQTRKQQYTAAEYREMAIKEKDLQYACEQFLMLNGFVKPGNIEDDRFSYVNIRGIFFHISEAVWKAIRHVPGVSDNLKNLPDLIVLNIDGRYWLPELKSKKGRKRKGQKALAKILPIEEHKLFDRFCQRFHEWLEE